MLQQTQTKQLYDSLENTGSQNELHCDNQPNIARHPSDELPTPPGTPTKQFSNLHMASIEKMFTSIDKAISDLSQEEKQDIEDIPPPLPPKPNQQQIQSLFHRPPPPLPSSVQPQLSSYYHPQLPSSQGYHGPHPGSQFASYPSSQSGSQFAAYPNARPVPGVSEHSSFMGHPHDPSPGRPLSGYSGLASVPQSQPNFNTLPPTLQQQARRPPSVLPPTFHDSFTSVEKFDPVLAAAKERTRLQDLRRTHMTSKRMDKANSGNTYDTLEALPHNSSSSSEEDLSNVGSLKQKVEIEQKSNFDFNEEFAVSYSQFCIELSHNYISLR